jgi:phosphoglycerol transferase MdoB-like AlkP superfamily enzyme
MPILLFQSTAAKEKTALFFFLKLLILGCLLKCIFFFYNYNVSGGWGITGWKNIGCLWFWGLVYDLFCLSSILLPFFAAIAGGGKYLQQQFVRATVAILFSSAITFFIFLNTVDIFYFRFHLQRADADMLYVLRNPLQNGTMTVLTIIAAALVLIIVCGTWVYRNLNQILVSANGPKPLLFSFLLVLIFPALFLISGPKKLLPTFPLSQLSAIQLPLVQNSFHSFVYSLYRWNATTLPGKTYMTIADQETIFSIHKKNNSVSTPKNIVLFIMESIPLDFFDSASPYKVSMPFLDSLVKKSTFYSNAFSFSYSSNKGITAILSGIPTITDIPLYHSNYTSIARVSIGSGLKRNGYRSAFFIGDNYDDFGFAKCSKWLGIDNYYSMEAIPGYKKMEKHSMGLHDEYVLDFMQQKLANIGGPFLAIQYNISTHYPNDLPSSFSNKYKGLSGTPQMKTMRYYNDCLQKFFAESANKAWFKNTAFIFSSDHWAEPDAKNIRIDEVESFRIPVFIYEPWNENKKVISTPVSQLDIVNTLLYYGGITDDFTSYGVNLKDSSLQTSRTIFTKTNTAIYQAINVEYVLGINAMEGTASYCYAYKRDPEKKSDLLQQPITPAIKKIILEMKAFLQTAEGHYRGRK